MIQAIKSLLRFLGVDRAIFFSNAFQAIRFLTSPVTMVLVLRYLTPEVQGYFYAFSGIVAMQTLLELGFSQNIVQFTAHEFSKLRFTSELKLEGDPVALSRIISLGRLAFVYYSLAALVILFVVGIGGHLFFSLSHDHGVAWQGAWWIISTTAAFAVMVNPAWALLEGCNKVTNVAQYRCMVSLLGFFVNALALWGGAGIYVPAICSASTFLFAVGYLFFVWKRFFAQFLTKPQHGKVSWRHEIWPLQWRVALSSMSGYFIYDIMNPIAFHFCGAVDAGRFGMSAQMVRMVFNTSMTWMYTKIPRFGILVATRQWKAFDALRNRSVLQAFLVCIAGMILFLVAIPLIGMYFPQVPRRFASLDVIAWLAGGYVVQVFTYSMAIELRSHKREPFAWFSVAHAILSVLCVLLLVKHLGISGEAIGYTLAVWLILPVAFKIYFAKRREYRNAAEEAAAREATGSMTSTFPANT